MLEACNVSICVTFQLAKRQLTQFYILNLVNFQGIETAIVQMTREQQDGRGASNRAGGPVTGEWAGERGWHRLGSPDWLPPLRRARGRSTGSQRCQLSLPVLRTGSSAQAVKIACMIYSKSA